MCYQQCDGQKHTIPTPFKLQAAPTSNYKLKLICRDATSMTLQIVDDTISPIISIEHNTESIVIPSLRHRRKRAKSLLQPEPASSAKRIYIIKVQERDNILSQNIIYIVSFKCVVKS